MKDWRQRDRVWMRAARVDAWTSQGGVCFWCHSEIKRDEVTAEHMIPRSNGGPNRSWNISAACYPCNLARGTINATKYRSMLRGKGDVPQRRIRERQIIFRLNRRAEQACRRILSATSEVA